MKFTARSTIAVLLAGVAACSGTAQKATPAARAQAGAHSPSPPVAAPAVDSAGVDPSLVKDGYRVVRQNGQILYCRSQSITGTKFSSKVCLTAAQIYKEQQDLQQAKDTVNKSRAAQCLTPGCGG